MNLITNSIVRIAAVAALVFLLALAAMSYRARAIDLKAASDRKTAEIARLKEDYGEAVKRAEIADGINKALLQQLEGERQRADTARAELNQAVAQNPQWAQQSLPPAIREAVKK